MLLEMMDYGVYEPEFGFDTSEEYKNKIKSIREEQKVLIREIIICQVVMAT